MGWAKLDDAFPDHPKIVQAGPLAGWLYVAALCYSARFLTDGFIPANQVRRLADVDNAPKLATRLVEVGLWESADGGYRIHDYEAYNPSREKALAEKARAKERMDRWRLSGERTGDEQHTDGEQTPLQTPNEQRNSDAPYPSPSPVSRTQSRTNSRPASFGSNARTRAKREKNGHSTIDPELVAALEAPL